ncbi:hypothetical protein [Paenibacillus sp. MSJ-34]|uniref:hypothetical protein n=1 Tax=Paenibacillus sp. MSJ-34 TaxID=2841529 RepID=UPI001C120591|nr:hypothetical protein [Paenibacillus sp. MSJ-34]MBU5440718.1 hypothetical protein [Paenibacillus sp. MSJ-34]
MTFSLSNNISIIFNFMIYLDKNYKLEVRNDNRGIRIFNECFPNVFIEKWNELVSTFTPNTIYLSNRDFVQWDNKYIMDRTNFFCNLFKSKSFFVKKWNDYFEYWHNSELQNKLDYASSNLISDTSETLRQRLDSEGINIKGNYCIQIITDYPSYEVLMHNKYFIFLSEEELKYESASNISNRLYEHLTTYK